MPASLLEIWRSIPDRRRAGGKRFDLATVLLYAILGMVAGSIPPGKSTCSFACICGG
jgi:hypothetical protein